LSFTVFEPTGKIRRSDDRISDCGFRISKYLTTSTTSTTSTVSTIFNGFNHLTKSPCALNLAPYASVIDRWETKK
jgi:hypothetical protein